MAASAFFFSLMSLFVKLAGQRLPSQEIVLARSVVTLVLSWGFLRRAGISPWGNRENRALLVLRGLLGFLALSCFYYSLTHLPIAESTVIQYTSPIFTALLAALLLGEGGGLILGVSTVLALLGVTLVARPAALFGQVAAGLPALAVGVGFAGALLSAGAYIAVRRLAQREHALVIIFYFPLVAVPAAVPPLLSRAVWPTAWEWLVLLAVGVSTQIAQLYLTRGLALEPAGRALAVGYLQVVFAATWGVLLFAERPDALTVLGAALVVAGALAPTLLRRRP